MQQDPFINRNAILRVFILLNETHVFKDFVEHYVIDLEMDWKVYWQLLEDREVLSDETLGCVFLVHKVDGSLWPGYGLVQGLCLLDVLAFLLAP